MTGDPIEDLLKRTGKRPEVSSTRRDRVRAVVEEVWKTDVASRARRRRARNVFWLSAAGLALAVAISVFEWPFGASQPSGLTVAHALGDAWAERGPWIFRSADAVRDGVPIMIGALVTTDTHAKAALRDAAGRSIRLDGGTALRVDASDHLELVRGAVYIATGGAHAGLRVETPFGTIEDVGTQFQARLDGSRLVVRVREGQVRLGGRTRPSVAAAGQVIAADASKVAVAADPAAHEGWEWVEAAAPMMAIEGRSLAEFVAWAAGERGVRVRWADPALEAKASTVALHGSIDGMTLEKATESVMATTGISCRWAAGELVVGGQE